MSSINDMYVELIIATMNTFDVMTSEGTKCIHTCLAGKHELKHVKSTVIACDDFDDRLYEGKLICPKCDDMDEWSGRVEAARLGR